MFERRSNFGRSGLELLLTYLMKVTCTGLLFLLNLSFHFSDELLLLHQLLHKLYIFCLQERNFQFSLLHFCTLK